MRRSAERAIIGFDLGKGGVFLNKTASVRTDHRHTLRASYLGCMSQAVVNTFLPLLFLTFQRDYGIPLDRIALLVSFNFGTQLLVDFISAYTVDRIGYRKCIVAAHVFCAAGLAGAAVLPNVMSDPFLGLLASVLCYAVGGGLIEVLVSPIVEACPTEEKTAAMSLLHSFYCWGCVAVVVCSTLFFACFGTERWPVLAVLWALLPAVNAVYYALVPIRTLTEQGGGMRAGALVKTPLFWLLCLLMVCAGAAEQGMSQWASAFAESALGVSKTVGDLAGPCAFAILMGSVRLYLGKKGGSVNARRVLAVSCAVCTACYLTASLVPQPLAGLAACALCGASVGALWPVTFSLAARAMPKGGTAMFALLALAGDLGCSAGPGLVGFIAEGAGGSLRAGLLAGTLFPVAMFLALAASRKKI